MPVDPNIRIGTGTECRLPGFQSRIHYPLTEPANGKDHTHTARVQAALEPVGETGGTADKKTTGKSDDKHECQLYTTRLARSRSPIKGT